MAIGENSDLLARLKGVLPLWWPQKAPICDSVLSGAAQLFACVYSLLSYVKAQTRVAIATDGFLDLAAADYFGLRVQRNLAQSDDSFRQMIGAEVLRERVTRHGILQALQDLTGSPATMFEPDYGLDTGGYDTGYLGFNEAGAWGSRDMPYQALIYVQQPIGVGVPLVAGYDSSYSAYNGGYSALIDNSAIRGVVTNQDIYDTIEATRAAGTTMWVQIGPPPIKPAHLDVDFVLDRSRLS